MIEMMDGPADGGFDLSHPSRDHPTQRGLTFGPAVMIEKKNGIQRDHGFL
jgi:hypothetical protein